MRRRCTECATVVLAVAILATGPHLRQACSGPKDATVDRVFAAWSERENAVRSFRATWIHDRTYTKYWANCHVPATRDEYVTLRFGESVLTLDGDRLRFDSGAVDDSGNVLQFHGPVLVDEFGRGAHDDARRVFRDDRIRYDGGRPRVDPRDSPPPNWPRNLRAFTTVIHGTQSWQFLPAERGEYPEAYLFAGSAERLRDSLHYLPLIASARPSWLGMSAARCRIDAMSTEFRGRECCVLVDGTGLRREFWLDVDRDHVPLSIRIECDVLGARMTNRIDIEYFQDADDRWLPSGWTTVFLDNYGLMEQYAPATVIEATANPKINGEDFSAEFPVGTWVYDESTHEHAVVAAEGASVPISESELRQGLTHAELAARGTWRGAMGAAARSTRQSWSVRLVFIGCCLVAITVGLRRRNLRARARREPINA